MPDQAAGPAWRIVIESEPATIRLPGLTAIRVDPASRVIAVDGRDSAPEDEGVPIGPEWTVRDLRDGIYGGFHRLRPAEECFDAAGCASQGQHDLVAVQRDQLRHVLHLARAVMGPDDQADFDRLAYAAGLEDRDVP